VTKVFILDTETTGLGHTDKAVEYAHVVIEDGRIVDMFQTLINPGMPIPPEVSAVHHLTDIDVVDAMPHEQYMKDAHGWVADADYVGAHNAPFDKRFVPKFDKAWLCTLRAARHLVKEAPSHKNQVLRYFLKLKCDVPADLAPHRALYDAIVSANLFIYLQNMAGSVERLIELTQTPVIQEKISFGKHAGQRFDSLPTAYLQWLVNIDGKDEDFYATVKHYLAKKQGGIQR